MKKKTALLFAFLLCTSQVFWAQDSFFSYETSVGTGISIYNETTPQTRQELLNTSDYKRIITGLSFITCLNISNPVKILAGAETFCDFLWNNGEYYNSLDYAFLTGIKVYPGLNGLNLSISYVLGNRSDFSKTQNTSKSWGNGFKLAVQYDFMNDEDSKFKPLVGGYYRCVPRGNYSTDHILSIYGGIRF